MSNIVVGTVVAVALAVVLAGGSIGGVAAWKIVLAALGFVVFILGGRPLRRQAEKDPKRGDVK